MWIIILNLFEILKESIFKNLKQYKKSNDYKIEKENINDKSRFKCSQEEISI